MNFIIGFFLGFIASFIVSILIPKFSKYKEDFLLVVLTEKDAMVIERFGKFKKVLFKGFHLIIPFIDKPRTMHWRFSIDPRTGEPGPVNVSRHRIDLRDTIYDFPEQTVITSDNAQITIDGLSLIKIIDPKQVVYGVANFPLAVESLTEAGLRNVIGGMTLEETLTSREKINEALMGYLREHTKMWGVQIKTVEIKNITPDKKVFESMMRQTIAERDKLAFSQKAQAEKLMLEEVKKELGSDDAASKYIATLRYVEAFRELVSKKDGKVVFVPYDSSNLLSSLSVITELFEGKKVEQKAEMKNVESEAEKEEILADRNVLW